MLKVVEYFQKKSIFVFTSDIEWSPEWAIKEMLDIFKEYEVPLTPFITHDSKEISAFYRGSLETHVGLHPNFLEGSSHGSSIEDVVSHVYDLWPQSHFFRAHTFFDSFQVTDQFVRKGFLFDSNVCLFEQPLCTPLQHQSGMVRFPVFWEDDVHWNRQLPFKMDDCQFENTWKTPGLKVFNFHPLNVALNIPTMEFYQDHKFLYREANLGGDLGKYCYQGFGAKTFLKEVLAFVKRCDGECMYLDDLYRKFFVSKDF